MLPSRFNRLGIGGEIKPIQYIESTGTQYIDTGVKPDYANGDKVEISFYRASYTGGQPCAFGSRKSNVTNGVYALALNIIICDADASSSFPIYADERNNVTLSVDNNNVVINNTSYIMPRRVTSEFNAYLFGLNDSGWINVPYKGMKLYNWKYWKNGVLVQNLIPVLDANSVPCLYNLVDGTFFYNAGSGTFIYGEYKKKLNYLQSTGTQWINTNVKPDFANGDSIETTFSRRELSTGVAVFGSRKIPALNGFYALGGAVVYCDSTSYFSIPFMETGIITMTVDDNYMKFADKTYTMEKRVSCDYPFYLYSMNNEGQVYGLSSGTRIYEFKYFKNGVLNQHLIPVLDLNNVPCFYDEVSKQFYYNNGTGNFNFA